MKKTELTQIKTAHSAELLAKADKLKTEIYDLVLDKNMNKLKDIKAIWKKKKDLAQVLTILRQKQLVSELESKIKKNQKGDL